MFNYKYAIAIWLRYLIVEIPDVPWTGEIVSLSPAKLDIV